MTSSRRRLYLAAYALLLIACMWSLVAAGDLSLGRKPWENFARTASELSRPSFVDLWFGNPALEFKSDDGRVLRVENQQESEARFLKGLARAVWDTLKIATLGSLLAALMAVPFGIALARNMKAPRPVAIVAKFILDVCRSIHSLVFGLIFVGIVGLGPTAGILAIAVHSMGTYGKLYAEAIETMDQTLYEAGLAMGATPMQALTGALWPAVLPQWLSSHLYIWEYNVRDSTVLGLIGAGGLGLLVSEAVSLFQWGRLATILIAIVAMVIAFDALSRRLRRDLLGR
ncbi:MAG: phosphonate ABC transporter, permease protein PhnE [Betaproteobacteria bacterium]|nr:phosphonate ABC transporter, permease protein PhnE [Betaproteobacteria bacterium]